jgi:hypothetical protein
MHHGDEPTFFVGHRTAERIKQVTLHRAKIADFT